MQGAKNSSELGGSMWPTSAFLFLELIWKFRLVWDHKQSSYFLNPRPSPAQRESRKQTFTWQAPRTLLSYTHQIPQVEMESGPKLGVLSMWNWVESSPPWGQQNSRVLVVGREVEREREAWGQERQKETEIERGRKRQRGIKTDIVKNQEWSVSSPFHHIFCREEKMIGAGGSANVTSSYSLLGSGEEISQEKMWPRE